MPKNKTEVSLEFAFYQYLRKFYIENRARIRKSYTYQTKRFLEFNNPENRNAFLRTPQYEALEMYVFLKEFLNNTPLHKIFDDWFNKTGDFKGRSDTGIYTLFGEMNQDQLCIPLHSAPDSDAFGTPHGSEATLVF